MGTKSGKITLNNLHHTFITLDCIGNTIILLDFGLISWCIIKWAMAAENG